MKRTAIVTQFFTGSLLTAVLLTTACSGSLLAPGGAPIRAEVGAHYRTGPVSGSLQTPRGGTPGTTSPRRPELGEIGVEIGHEVGVDILASWRRHEVVLGNAALFLYGDATLQESLTTQADVYPVGTDVDSSTYITLHNLAYRYRLPLRLGREDTLHVMPGVGATAFRMNYLLDGSNGESADRSYSLTAPHVELGLRWRPRNNPHVWFSADVRQSLRLKEGGRALDLLEAAGRVHYDLNRALSAHLEAGFRHVGFEDTQEVPNRIDVDFGPWVGLGVSVRF